MQFDFTIDTYKKLLNELIANNYSFQTFSEYLKFPKDRVIILRHDVDRLPENSLKFALLQHDLGIKGTYYFRAVKESWNEEIIKQIANLGHEIGYHYENLTSVSRTIRKHSENCSLENLILLGLQDFDLHLKELRMLAPVETICMHGSPMSKYDSKDLWINKSYKDFKIIGEPYFDIDFEKVFYLTDTGRCWDGFNVSVRDKIGEYQEKWKKSGNVYNTSFDILEELEQKSLPPIIMFTFHPQRWSDSLAMWMIELIFQNIKNPIKMGLVYFRRLISFNNQKPY